MIEKADTNLHCTDTKTSITVSSKTEERRHFASDQQITVLRDVVVEIGRRFIREYRHVDEDYIDSVTIESLINYIDQERLINMPHQGGKWDRVLKWAEFFALQIAGYEEAVSPFVPDSRIASKLIGVASQVLLEVCSIRTITAVKLLLTYLSWEKAMQKH
jgi:hypothetical protein